MPSFWNALESSAVIVAVECNPASDISCRTKLYDVRYNSDHRRAKCLPVLRKVPDERFQRCFIEALAHPVEGRTQIVHQLLSRISVPYFSCKPAGSLYVWICCLQPQEISIRSELYCSLCSCRKSSTIVIEALSSPWNIPRERDWSFGVCRCKLPSVIQRHVSVFLNFSSILIDLRLVCSFRFQIPNSSYSQPISSAESSKLLHCTHPRRRSSVCASLPTLLRIY